MELRELHMAETTAFGVGVDPARITLAAGRLLSGASCDRDEQVTVRNLGSGTPRPEPCGGGETGRQAVPESVPQISFRNIRTEMKIGVSTRAAAALWAMQHAVVR
jgi:hypothetical protein